MHLSDEQLNEYLDKEIQDRVQVELHLSSCPDCAARLVAIRALFNEIESLPELSLSRDIAAPITRRISRRASFPRALRLTVILQAAAAIVTMIFTAPFMAQFTLPYLSVLPAPTLADLAVQLQTKWRAWLDIPSQLRLPAIPDIPVIQLSGLFIMFTVAGVSVLWLIGNGLLLKNQMK